MKTFLRHIILSSVVGVTALPCIDGKIVVAAPLPKNAIQRAIPTIREVLEGSKAFKGAKPVIEEISPAIRERGAEEAVQRTRPLGEKEASQLVEQREAEAARRRQAETREEVSPLFNQLDRSINDRLRPNLVVRSEEQLQTKIREAVAKGAADAANQPNSKYSFNPWSGTLTLKKPLVSIKGVEVKEINLYAMLTAVDGAKYILECLANKNMSECVTSLLERMWG